MSEAMIVGVGWVIIGLAMLALGRLLQDWAARAYVRNNTDGDVSRYMRRKLLYKNMLAGFTISVGTAVLIYDYFWGTGTAT
jgi:uncharacterized membrane protein